MRLLAVDDDPIFLELLVSTLSELGYNDILPVSSPMEALHELDVTTVPFDCLLFDIQMPQMDGIQLTREVRKQSRLAHVPIIMITSVQQRESVDQAFAAGANDYIVKPLQATEIQARLGMIERLNQLNEQVRLGGAGQGEGQSWQFRDAIPLERRDHVVDFLALENYLLTIGRLRMSNICAFGISLMNAADRFSRVPHDEYTDTLNDIAAILTDQLQGHRPLVAHAGSGRFVVILPRVVEIDTIELETIVNAELEMLYSSVHLPDEDGTMIRVGKVKRPSVLTGFSAKALLSDVLEGMSSDVGLPAHVRFWYGAA